MSKRIFFKRGLTPVCTVVKALSSSVKDRYS